MMMIKIMTLIMRMKIMMKIMKIIKMIKIMRNIMMMKIMSNIMMIRLISCSEYLNGLYLWKNIPTTAGLLMLLQETSSKFKLNGNKKPNCAYLCSTGNY